MSSGLREHDIDVDLDRQEKEHKEEQTNIKLIADEIMQIEPGSSEYKNLIWLHINKDKIIRNINLINLLG